MNFIGVNASEIQELRVATRVDDDSSIGANKEAQISICGINRKAIGVLSYFA